MTEQQTTWLIVAAVLIYWFFIREEAPVSFGTTAATIPGAVTANASLALGGPIPGASTTGSNPNLTQSLEAGASAVTHVPLSAVGSLAQKAPTWLKVAVFPVGVTAVVQDIIDDPKGAAKTVGKDAVKVGQFAISSTERAAHATAAATADLAKDAASAVAHGAVAGAKAVGSAAKKVGSALASLNPF